ncbi:threonylcarbamoyl-AMP synthase [Polymorphobacter glacialis]|uniref:Threonylcarbamoyl-AMP synthase n=1 Tax=Sandarakinorhabdus glacialis TaxID=1614636 RepID=A0A917EAS1_9SPHN|nr:L-threonylcarbamoyladenylate synthase [Polymorphobacter glacialis]GGE16999.1 threonylcarbamoyl-AMP synthase [Polymorphobacter glacialis]
MVDKSRILVADVAAIAEATAVLLGGGIVAVPTETVYGLAARAGDAAAVARIYQAKGRPSFNPLIVHVSGVAQAAELVEIDAVSARLMAAFWPGALTLVLPLKAGAAVAGLVTAGLSTLAVRCPAHFVMQALIAGAGPLAAPSANASGRISSTTAAHVAESLGKWGGLILDGGACAAGVESTILAVGVGGVRLLRAGAMAVEDIMAVLGEMGTPTPLALGGESPSPQGGGRLLAPGMMASHYAPLQPLRMNVVAADVGEFHVGFGDIVGDLNLSAVGDVVEAAARLFDVLHIAEASGRAGIAVAPVPIAGLGLAINDRLRRAAAPK